MRRSGRLALLVLLLALAGAAAPERSDEGLIYCGLGTGRAAYLPSFYVDPGLYGVGMGPPGPTGISLCATYGATAKVVFLAPRGVTIRLDTPVDTKIGTLYAKVRVGKRTVNLTRPLASIVTADPARYSRNACAPGLHDAVWLLRARSEDGKVRLALPLYLDAAGGDAAYRLQLCFGSPNGKRPIAGWPARATFRLLTLTVDQSVLAEAPAEPAAYVWRGIFTPFRATGSPNAAAAVEARATQLLPVVWTLAGSYDAGLARVSGRLTQGGQPVAGLTIVVWRGTALGGDFPGIVNPSTQAAATDAGGGFSATVPITQTTYFRASGGTVLHYARCRGPSLAPKGCVSSSTSGFAGPSAIVAVPVP